MVRTRMALLIALSAYAAQVPAQTISAVVPLAIRAASPPGVK